MKNKIGITVLLSVCFLACTSNNSNNEESVGKTSMATESPKKAKEDPFNTPNNGVHGTWKVVDFVDNIVGVDEKVKKGGEAVARSSVYYIKKDSLYTIKSSKTPDGDEGVWRINVVNGDSTISFSSNKDKYKETYQLKYLGNRMEWMKEIENFGSYSMVLIRQ